MTQPTWPVPLTALCVDVLAAHVELCPSLRLVPEVHANELVRRVLRQRGLTPATLRLLGTLDVQLYTLDLRPAAEKTDATLWAAATTLRQVDGLLTVRAGIAERDLRRLGMLTNLRRLSLVACAAVTDASMPVVAAMEQLTALNIAQTPVTARALEVLDKGVPQLRELVVAWCVHVKVLPFGLVRRLLLLDAQGLVHSALDALKPANKLMLQHLNVSRQKLSKLGRTASVAFAPSLVSLALARNTFAAFEPGRLPWRDLQNVAVLDLHKCDVDAETLLAMWEAVAKQVQVLLLRGVVAADDRLCAAVASTHSKALTHLDLTATSTTFAGALRLTELHSLRRLSLRKCAINTEAREELRARFMDNVHLFLPVDDPEADARVHGLSFDHFVPWTTR